MQYPSALFADKLTGFISGLQHWDFRHYKEHGASLFSLTIIKENDWGSDKTSSLYSSSVQMP